MLEHFPAKFRDPFQPESVEAQMHRVYSATIGLLGESHGIVVSPPSKFPQNHKFFINLSNCKQQTPKAVSERQK
jgi:hypothetical protein